MLSQSTIQRCDCHRDAVWPWSPWQHCLLSCPVAPGAVPPLPVAFGQQQLLIAQPQGRHCPRGVQQPCGEVLQCPWKWRARGENPHILFQIARTSQDSFLGVCTLFVSGDEVRYLSRFEWPICASSSMHSDCISPLRPSECGS